jgi:hypothetical protein
VYQTCTFCYANLGRNEVLETLDVARRVAFDPAKGLVWAVCPQCARWNLLPIEERWAVVDECERRFRLTTLRYTSGNIGLAWLAGDIELVRVGPALRPEVAAWRYGRILARPRPLRSRVTDVIASAYVGTRRWITSRPQQVLRDPRAAAAELLMQMHGNRVLDVVQLPSGARTTPRLGDSSPIAVVRFRHLLHASLIRPESGKPWSLAIPHDDGMLEIEGDSGVRAAARALAIINGTERGGGFSHAVLEAATRKVDESAQDRAYFNRVLSLALRSAWGHRERARALPPALRDEEVPDGATSDVERLAFRLTGRTFWGRGGIGSEPITALLDVPLVDRLALEMAAHEETERRALEGELEDLEDAWREADEIAAIADALLR